MNHEILERLLIDRALGQLPEDVEALLAEHLSSSPETRTMAEQIQESVNLAAMALPRPRTARPAPLQISGLVRTERIRRGLALAASFAIGASVAFFGMRAAALRSERPPNVRAVAEVRDTSAPPHLSAEVKREAESLPFWSNRRVFLLTTNETHHAIDRANP